MTSITNEQLKSRLQNSNPTNAKVARWLVSDRTKRYFDYFIIAMIIIFLTQVWLGMVEPFFFNG